MSCHVALCCLSGLSCVYLFIYLCGLKTLALSGSFVVDSVIIMSAATITKDKQDELEHMFMFTGLGVNVSELTLLYRGTRDGMTPKAFHDKCDGWKGPTLTLVQTDRGWIFGGYAGTSWASWDPSSCLGHYVAGGNYVADPTCFVFNVNNPYNDPIRKMPVLKPDEAMYCNPAFGPSFPGAFGLHRGGGRARLG